MLQDMFLEHNMVEAAVKVAEAKVQAFIEDNEKWIHLHQRAEYYLAPEQIAKWTSDVASLRPLVCDTTVTVREFLENAGQQQLLIQFGNAEDIFCKVFETCKQDLQTCILLLGHYSSMHNLYPQSHKQDHRTTRWVHFCS